MKKLLLIFLSVVIALTTFVGCGGEENYSDNFTLSLHETSLAPGEVKQLYAHLEDRRAEVKWSSSEEGVATVDKDGLVSALRIGEANVTATVGEKSEVCVVKVIGAEYSPVLTVKQEKLSVFKGESFTSAAYVTLGGVKVDANLTWESENTSVATVENGTINGIAEGETTIKVSCVYNGEKLSEKITVKVLSGDVFFVKESGLKLAMTSINGEDTQTQLTTKIALSGNKPVTGSVEWNSDNEEVATVDEHGLVTSVKKGVARITATYTEVGGVSLSSWSDVEIYKATVTGEKAVGATEIQSDDDTLRFDLPDVGYAAVGFEEISATVCNKTFDGTLEDGHIVINTDGTIYGNEVVQVELGDRIFNARSNITAKNVTYKTNSYLKNASGEYVLDGATESHTIRYSASLFDEVFSRNSFYVINTVKSDPLDLNVDGTSEFNLYYDQAAPVGNTDGKVFFCYLSGTGKLGSEGVTIERKAVFEGKANVFKVTNNVQRTYIRPVGITVAEALAQGYTKLTFNLFYTGAPNVVGQCYPNDLFSFHMESNVSKQPLVTIKNTGGSVMPQTSQNQWYTIEITLDGIESTGNAIKCIDFILGCEQGFEFYINDAKLI